MDCKCHNPSWNYVKVHYPTVELFLRVFQAVFRPAGPPKLRLVSPLKSRVGHFVLGPYVRQVFLQAGPRHLLCVRHRVHLGGLRQCHGPLGGGERGQGPLFGDAPLHRKSSHGGPPHGHALCPLHSHGCHRLALLALWVHPLRGSVLLAGKQTVYMPYNSLYAL